MKNMIVSSLMLINAATASADNTFEIISLEFKQDVPFEQQQQAMSSLNQVVQTFEGFQSRDYFYSQENGRWIDLIVWSSIDLAKQASAKAMETPEATKVFGLMDESSMIFSYYSQVDGIKKEK